MHPIGTNNNYRMEDFDDGIKIEICDTTHQQYVADIMKATKAATRDRNLGLAQRTAEFLNAKMNERKAVIALFHDELAGFCYIESWENKQYVTNSGLIVLPKFRGRHLATRIKNAIFSLSRQRWPNAKIYGLTSSAAVMHINSSLGYVPIPFSEMPTDDVFWKACGNLHNPKCVNCDILIHSQRRYCVCTGMVFDPSRHPHTPLPVQLPLDVIEFIEKSEQDA